MLIGNILAFLAEHADLISLVYDMITSGKTTKQQMMDAIKASMVAASDAEMMREFPNG